jgi:hypothetical protein
MGFGSWGSVLGVVFCAFWAGFGPALLKFILLVIILTEAEQREARLAAGSKPVFDPVKNSWKNTNDVVLCYCLFSGFEAGFCSRI